MLVADDYCVHPPSTELFFVSATATAAAVLPPSIPTNQPHNRVVPLEFLSVENCFNRSAQKLWWSRFSQLEAFQYFMHGRMERFASASSTSAAVAAAAAASAVRCEGQKRRDGDAAGTCRSKYKAKKLRDIFLRVRVLKLTVCGTDFVATHPPNPSFHTTKFIKI